MEPEAERWERRQIKSTNHGGGGQLSFKLGRQRQIYVRGWHNTSPQKQHFRSITC